MEHGLKGGRSRLNDAMNAQRFKDRNLAGRLLAAKLMAYAGRDDVLVLALPRGGVPVGREVARALGAPLDVFIVRKLGVPGQEELAMGAIASGGVRVLNEPVIRALRIPPDAIERVTQEETLELKRRERLYRGDRPWPALRNRVILLVDDGIATGSTVRAAIAALRAHGARHLVVAAPTIAPDTFEALRSAVDAVVAVLVPETFQGVGQWYEDFSQTSDAEVRAILEEAA